MDFFVVVSFHFVMISISFSNGVIHCGKPYYKPNTQLVPGIWQRAPRHTWPWHGHIALYTTRSPLCSVALITLQWILTTAWCAGHRIREKRFIQFATVNRSIVYDEIVTHPLYERRKDRNYDIAALKLDKPITSEDAHYVSPICIPKPGESVMLDARNSFVTIENKYDWNLYQVELRLSAVDGSRSHGNTFIASNPPNQVVTVEEDGAPFMYYDHVHDQWNLLGLRSILWEHNQFMNVTAFMDLVEHIRAFEYMTDLWAY